MHKDDRRTSPRFFVRILVDYKSADSFLYDYSNDLSEGGIFIQTPSPLTEGEQLDLRFTLPGTDRLFQVRGEVTWVHRRAEGAKDVDSVEALGNALDDLLEGVDETPQSAIPEGMGIRFLNITEDEQRLLRDFLQRDRY